MAALPLVQIVHRPSIIDLGWGHPDPALLPVDAIRRACASALERFGPDALQYGHVAGPGPLLEWLITRIAQSEGHAPASDEVMITGGNSSALECIVTMCTLPNDTVLVESPTYHLAIRILRDHRLNLIPVPSDGNGMVVEALAAQLVDLKHSGTRVRALYTVPTFGNPTGASLSEARRELLVELAAAEELLIIEDDVYRELAYDASAPRSLWSMAPSGTVARMGSFSKSLAPGLRLGWLTASRDLIGRLTHSGVLESGGGVNHFTAMAVAMLCEAGDFDAHVARLCAAYRTRRDALLAALREHLPSGCRFDTPAGGFFVWLTLPSGISSDLLLSQAEASGTSYAPSTKFYLGAGGHNALRLAFSLYSSAKLAEAARRLGYAIRSFS